MSDTGVILFHDINVHERNFGVWQFWQELLSDYIGISFMHSHGLGVLYVGRQDNAIAQMFRWLTEKPAYMGVAQNYLERLGEIAIDHSTRASEMDARDAKIEELLSYIEHRDATIRSMTSEVVAIEQDELDIKDPEVRAVVRKSLKRFEKIAKFKRMLNFAFKSRRRRYKAQYVTAKSLLAKLKQMSAPQ
jgi:hypothetical protein